MENYNEKVNYGTEAEPLLRDRLYITSASYGYNLFDRKAKKNLLFCKSKELCDEGLALLLANKENLFNLFKERIKDDEVVIPTKILVDNNKYGQDYYSIPTIKDLYKVALRLLEIRFDNNCFYKYDIPNELDYTYEDVEKMPESFRKDAKSKLDNHNKHIKECKEVNNEYETVKKAIDEKNGNLAWTIIKNREGYEYEKIDIITPKTI